MSEENPKRSVKGKIILWVLILLGIYFTFLPNRFATSSIFDFIKGEPVAPTDSFDLEGFSKIPVLRGGRVKPIDSVARNTLLVMRNKRTAIDENGNKVPAINWFAEVLFNPESADNLKSFLVDDDQVLGLLGKKLSRDGKFFSYNELEPFLNEIDSNARESGKVVDDKRDSFDQNIIDLYRAVLLYRKIKSTLSPSAPDLSAEMEEQLQVGEILFDPLKDKDLTEEFSRFRSLTKELSTRPEDIRMGSADFAKVVFFLDYYSRMNMWSEFFVIPPEADDPKKQWRTIGESLVGKEPLDSREKQKMDPARFASTLQELVSMEPTALKARLLDILENQKMDPTVLFASQYAEAIKLRREVDPVLGLYETLKSSYANDDYAQFNATVAELRKVGKERAGEDAATLGFEKVYNGFEPFYRSSIAYVLIFAIAGISWLFATYSIMLGKKDELTQILRNCAYILTAIVLASHTFGLIGRMYIEGRPPVTNLYSSALFIGWGAVLLCFFTEKFLRLGVASAMGSLVGFGSLVIAHNLSLDSSINPSGDTMEMMQAVLDSNFWLATHVVIITIGYSTTFLAGFLGIAYVCHKLVLSFFGGSNKYGAKLIETEKDAHRILGAMIYGITCFSIFFSLVGTVLGGIWADQSWGRFWGWDAKENGALLIVIWNAILLHARWSGIAKIRGIAAIAIFGNVVTAWSWFGTNLLGVGLHSYGFMKDTFDPLINFILSQIFIIALAYIPDFRIKTKSVATT